MKAKKYFHIGKNALDFDNPVEKTKLKVSTNSSELETSCDQFIKFIKVDD